MNNNIILPLLIVALFLAIGALGLMEWSEKQKFLKQRRADKLDFKAALEKK